jgi:hypothetical protein
LDGFNGSGTTPADGNPKADGISPSTTGGGSGSADGNASASSSPSESEEKGGLSGWWEKTKNYVASGQILKDAAHLGKETLDFLILDDVSGCFTGKDTDGNELAGWERGLRCVSLVPAAKVAKVGKYADEALAFAGKLDDKLAKTRLGEGIQTAKKKLEDRFRRGKEVACGCDDNVGSYIGTQWYTRVLYEGTVKVDGEVVDVSRVVYQKNDIDWDYVDRWGRTNLQRAADGNAPIGRDGKPIELHHLSGEEPGPMIELEYTIHQKNIKKNFTV